MLSLATQSLTLAVVAQPGVWIALSRGYPGDSLFTLDPLEIAGLVVLSSVMALLLFRLILWKSGYLCGLLILQHPVRKSHYLLADITTTVGLCLIALWLAPQIHYTYYQLIIDSLPMQWVVGGGFDVPQLLRLMILRTDGTIAEHATGIVIWACIFSSVLKCLTKSADRFPMIES